MRVLPAGADAVLLDFSDADDPAAATIGAAEVVRAAAGVDLAAVTDVIPTAHTVLVQAGPGRGIDTLGLHRVLRGPGAHPVAAGVYDEVRIPVSYDGDDLSDVAGILDMTVDEVIAAHQRIRWRVQFMGFAPGFGYLVPQGDSPEPLMSIGRRAESRTRVPAGSVAIAAGYSAVYPRVSPGGWHLLGHTDIDMWDETAQPPALLAPGKVVRFVDVDGARGR